MKRVILVGMVLCMILGSVGCNTNKVNENKNSIVKESNAIEKLDIQGNSKENQNTQSETKEEKKIKPMNESDLTVTDGVNMITLDSLYYDFETTEKEKIENASENNYVGEIYSEDDTMYKVFIHIYNDFTIYTANINYDYKEVDYDTYYIMQIDIDGGEYETARGVHIGDTKEDIYKVYGEESKEDKDKETNPNSKILDNSDYQIKEEIEYNYKNYALLFSIDQDDIIRVISLIVNPLGEVEDENTEAQVNADNVDLLDYVVCSKQEFIKNTGLEVSKEPDGDEYELYMGYSENLQVYFEDESAIMIQFFGEIEGYSLLGLNCGMRIDDAINELEKKGLECIYDDNAEVYEVNLKEDKSEILFIRTENYIITFLFYSINEIY